MKEKLAVLLPVLWAILVVAAFNVAGIDRAEAAENGLVFDLVTMLDQNGDLPYWCDGEVHEGVEECGCCGEEITRWRCVLNYRHTEWVPVCDECYSLVATEKPLHRFAMSFECRVRHMVEGR